MIGKKLRAAMWRTFVPAASLMIALSAPTAALAAEPGVAVSGNEKTTDVNVAMEKLFDSNFYATEYPDVAPVYGAAPEDLWQHFMQYGLREGRVLNELFDVRAYRAGNPDLEEAFGDDWEAYWRHYFQFGLEEIMLGKRSTAGMLFNPLEYSAAYSDVLMVYGNDWIGIMWHYLMHGKAEGRTIGVYPIQEATVETLTPPQEPATTTPVHTSGHKTSGGSGGSSGSGSGGSGTINPNPGPSDPGTESPDDPSDPGAGDDKPNPDQPGGDGSGSGEDKPGAEDPGGSDDKPGTENPDNPGDKPGTDNPSDPGSDKPGDDEPGKPGEDRPNPDNPGGEDPVDPKPDRHEHQLSKEWSYDQDAHWRECTAEGCDISDNAEKADYGLHEFGDWTVTIDRDEEGKMTTETGQRSCAVCEMIEMYQIVSFDPIDPIPRPHRHQWSTDWSVNEVAHWHVCTAYGCYITDETEMDSYELHELSDWAIVVEPTATEEGKRSRSCAVCNFAEVETIPAKGEVATPSNPEKPDPEQPEKPDVPEKPSHTAENCPDKADHYADWTCPVCGASGTKVSVATPSDPEKPKHDRDSKHKKADFVDGECKHGCGLTLEEFQANCEVDHTGVLVGEYCSNCGAEGEKIPVATPSNPEKPVGHPEGYEHKKNDFDADGSCKTDGCNVTLEEFQEACEEHGEAHADLAEGEECENCGFKKPTSIDPDPDQPKPEEPDPTIPVGDVTGNLTVAEDGVVDIDMETILGEGNQLEGVSEETTVKLTLDVKDATDEVGVTLSDTTMSTLTELNNAGAKINITLTSTVGDVTIPFEALKKTGAADGVAKAATLVVRWVDVDSDEFEIEDDDIDPSNMVVVDVLLEVDGEELTITGLSEVATVTVDAPMGAEKVRLYYIKDNGSVKRLSSTPIKVNANGQVRFNTKRLSEIYLGKWVDETDDPVKDPCEDGHDWSNEDGICARCELKCPNTAQHSDIFEDDSCRFVESRAKRKPSVATPSNPTPERPATPSDAERPVGHKGGYVHTAKDFADGECKTEGCDVTLGDFQAVHDHQSIVNFYCVTCGAGVDEICIDMDEHMYLHQKGQTCGTCGVAGIMPHTYRNGACGCGAKNPNSDYVAEDGSENLEEEIT